MFPSSTIIRKLALNLAKVIFMLKHFVKLRRYLLCGFVAACHGMACVLPPFKTEIRKSDIYVYFNVFFKIKSAFVGE